MAFNHTLSAILRGQWALDRNWADAHIPLVIAMLNGSPVSMIERSGSETMELPFAIQASTMQRYEMFVRDANYNIIPNPNIPPNSVGILPIIGPVTKYNGECGEPGSVMKNTWLLDMQKRANIGSIVLLSDTPGGEVRAASTLTSTIQRSKKPVLSYVDGMTASLGVWFSAACSESYLADDMSTMGSVGSYCTVYDFSGLLEKAGIKVHEIYAPQSTDKNKDYKDALNNNYDAIKADLARMTANFITHVKNNRPAAAAKESQWNTGRMFPGKEAVKAGLADGIMSFDKVVSRAVFLAKK